MDDLYINSEYFYKSEYIKKILKENENKEIIGPVYLKIKDDARIAYAVNGFYIDTNKKTVYQYIDFAPRNDKSTYTYFERAWLRLPPDPSPWGWAARRQIGRASCRERV